APNVKAFSAEVAGAFNGCDLAKILDGLSMMAFCAPISREAGAGGGGAPTTPSGAGALVAGERFAAFVQHGLKTPKDAHGITVEKSDVLGEVKGLDERLFPKANDPLFASAQQIYTDWGGFKRDLVGRGILATLDQFEKLVEGFTNLKSATPLLNDIHALA